MAIDEKRKGNTKMQRIEIINGKETVIGPNECKADYPCPRCGGDLITNYGPGISITFCEKCNFSDDDVFDIFDDF